MRLFHTFSITLLAAGLISLMAWPGPAHSQACAKSQAADRAGLLYATVTSEAALPFAQDARSLAELTCGSLDVAIIAPLTDLAMLYQDLGRYGEAETLLRRIVEIKLTALSPDDKNQLSATLPNMIIDFNNLAFVYGAQGKFEAAGKLFQHVLEIAERAVGEEHILVSQALRNLAGNYRAKGAHDKASPLLVRAAQIEKSAYDEIPENWAEALGLRSPTPQTVSHVTEADQLLRSVDPNPR